MTSEPAPGVQAHRDQERRTRRPVRRIVGAVVLSVVIVVGLAAWVFLVPYESSVDEGDGGKLSCSSDVFWELGPSGQEKRAEFDRSCDEAESSRRTVALVAGAAVATLAAAVSTWPSRRLTGEELGPLR